MLKTLPALAAFAAAMSLVVPTVSQAAEQTSVRVSYADLNLATDFGQHRLQRRIAYAAGLVCDKTDGMDLVFARAVAECQNATISDAQPAFAAAVAAARHPSVTVLDATTLIVTVH